MLVPCIWRISEVCITDFCSSSPCSADGIVRHASLWLWRSRIVSPPLRYPRIGIAHGTRCHFQLQMHLLHLQKQVLHTKTGRQKLKWKRFSFSNTLDISQGGGADSSAAKQHNTTQATRAHGQPVAFLKVTTSARPITDAHKFLCVHTEERLTWGVHTTAVIKKKSWHNTCVHGSAAAASQNKVTPLDAWNVPNYIRFHGHGHPL